MKFRTILLVAGLITAANGAVADEAFNRLKREARGGAVAAQIMLADIYSTRGDNYDIEAAETWYLKAAASGKPEGEFALANFYAGKSDHGGPQDSARAQALYEGLAARGYLPAIETLCSDYFNGAKWTPADAGRAVGHCKTASQLGSLDAKRVLVKIYSDGLGGEARDGAAAIALLREVSDKTGKPDDLMALAHAYYDGRLTPPQYDTSFGLYQTVVRRGGDAALPYLAAHYEKGLGTAVEVKEAERLYFYSGRRGNALAMSWLQAHPGVGLETVEANTVKVMEIPFDKYLVERPMGDGTLALVPMRGPHFGYDIGEFYPERAAEDEVEGSVDVSCHINHSGDFDNCIAIAEMPPGYGFARATERMMGKEVKPVTFTNKEEFARTYGGKSWALRIRWMLS